MQKNVIRAKRLLKKEEVKEVYRLLEEKFPEAQTELNYTNPYTLLVAVALSAQSTDIGVNKATKLLFQEVSKPQDILDMGIEKLKERIKTIGLYNTKANNVYKAAQMLVKEYKGEIPNSREELVKLPGVGRKTANVVLNIAYSMPYIAVDTHIFRISNRVGLAKGKTPEEVEEKLTKVTPKENILEAHKVLILQGRYICKASKPMCKECNLVDLCQYPDKNL